MNEAQLYEMLGRRSASLEVLNAQFDLVLATLGQVVTGEMDRSRVLVDLTNRGFSVSAPGTRPAMPATINGLPNCLMAPDEVLTIDRNGEQPPTV